MTMGPLIISGLLLLIACVLIARLFGRNQRLVEELRNAKATAAQGAQALDVEREKARHASLEGAAQAEKLRHAMDELTSAKERLLRYKDVQQVEEAVAKLRAAAQTVEEELRALRQEKVGLQVELGALRREQQEYQIDAQIREFGLYQPSFNLEDSGRYKAALQENYERQKAMTRADEAARCQKTWAVDGDYQKGRRMTDQYLKLMLWAFNGECDALISQVRYDNVEKIKERVRKLFERINKLGQEKSCAITEAFLELKLQELALVHELNEKKQAEAEEQRMLREQMREEEKARRDLERVQQEAEREAARYQMALAKAQKEAEKAHGHKLATLQGEIERLGQLLTEANARKDKAISQAQLTKRGHVYVISNIGSFGENVYKIGMTRRLDPMERVDELGDASVPFRFDVHAMIFSDDAPRLESTLHRLLDHRRVNLVNPRKEFFSVTLEEVQRLVAAHHGEFQLTLVAEAEEYRKSQMARLAPGDRRPA